MTPDPESLRLASAPNADSPWRLWGPYLSERQWGTVREDYSADGAAWDYFPHDHARSRAYRWGEDGLLGISDSRQRLCFAVALWNENDPILKERLFGLTNAEGNHGEDVKEIYHYLDATPTHSYLRGLYKYPHAAFPYARLIGENRRRGRQAEEFELLDTGVFDADRYHDVVVEYAKAACDDILIRITVHNRGPEAAALHVLPTLWFRNTWSWAADAAKPALGLTHDGAVEASHARLGTYRLHLEGGPELLFCDNETNAHRLFGRPASGHPKDAINDHVVHGRVAATNPARTGTKCAARYRLDLPAGGARTLRLRLRALDTAAGGATGPGDPWVDFERIFSARRAEADAFYAPIQRELAGDDARLVQRQAFAGMIWSKQFYHYDVRRWAQGDPGQPPPPASRRDGRNADWCHLNNADIISMPDKWEYPWYAAWDLAFHCIPLAQVDPAFAKDQLVLLTREWYMHANGQLPAYEWAFGDVNPPVHAWATWRVFQIDRKHRGDAGDLAFLERVFHKLMINFTWWVNRKDAEGRNVFQGGFLGLDNIGIFDRSAPLPTGGHIDQADGTSWMAMYALNLMRIALELARHNPVYEDIATKFCEHFLHIAEAMNRMGEDGVGLWCEEDEFYYDVLRLPGGGSRKLKVRSLVGLIPLYAVEVLSPELLAAVPQFTRRLEWILHHRPDLARLVSRWSEPGLKDRHLLSLLRGHRMKCLLRRMLDETEFLSDYGVRAISRHHHEHPYELHAAGQNLQVRYEPAESSSGLFGGNSNWRGPVWMPVNFLLIESLQKFHHYYGDDFKVECPTRSGRYLTLAEIATELSTRLTRLFLKDERGRRPVSGAHEKMASDPHFRDLVFFHEYFHGDSGRGVGASHQTGWTGLVAKLLQPRQD